MAHDSQRMVPVLGSLIAEGVVLAYKIFTVAVSGDGGFFTCCTPIGVDLGGIRRFLELSGIPNGDSLEWNRELGEDDGDLDGV